MQRFRSSSIFSAPVFALFLLAFPQLASAQTILQGLGLFNIIIGLMFVASVVIFVGGFVSYLCRLGNNYREEGLDYMELGLTILFVLIIILGIARVIRHFFG